MASDAPAVGPGSGSSPPGGSQPAAIDLEQLADRIYRLMQAELRLETARGGRSRRE